MTEPAAPTYPWYADTTGEGLEQGDILLGCPRFVVPPETLSGAEENPVRVEEVNAIILTQSCDLAVRNNGQCKVRDVLLCRLDLKEELKQHATFKEEAGWENARKGLFASYHALNRCELEGLALDFMLVDFHEVFTLRVDLVRRFATTKGRRPRLLPPYREHLAQAFARLFMRVGLPTDIPPFAKKK